MSTLVESNGDRVSRRQADKFAERRNELAASALLTLAELGYARTSLRLIAQNSEYSHGVLHYYFADKVDLITESVRQYKAACVTRYDEVVARAGSAAALRVRFGAAMADTLVQDGTYHRLWYDLRTQSLFEPSYRADVAEIDDAISRMIWRIVERYAELSGAELVVGQDLAYAAFDGIFQHHLGRHLAGEATAAAALARAVEDALTTLVPAP